MRNYFLMIGNGRTGMESNVAHTGDQDRQRPVENQSLAALR